MNKFFGLRIDALSMEQSIQACEALIALRGKQHVVLNAAKVVSAYENPKLSQIINDCDLVNADGMAVVWAARLLGIKIPERVAGIDLMNKLVDLSSSKGYSIFLLGSQDWVVKRTYETFKNRMANIVGYRNGYWRPFEELEVVQEIASKSPDILFLAIPSPMKEIFLSDNLEKLNCGLVVGVGGSFDVVAGLTKRAPVFLQKLGFEWFYRLVQEPRRMLKRYLLGNTKFIRIFLTHWLKNVFSRKNNSNV